MVKSIEPGQAHGRGKATQRFEHTEGLLGSHQAVPGEMIRSLNQAELVGSNIFVAMFDNNSPTRELAMFAAIDISSKKIIIYNEEMMQNWIKKENINPKAQPDGPIYLEKPIRSTTDYFGPLIEKGFDIEFSEPGISMQFRV